MKGTNTIRICKAEMTEWAQEALEARFSEEPGKVTNVKEISADSCFEIAIKGDEPKPSMK